MAVSSIHKKPALTIAGSLLFAAALVACGGGDSSPPPHSEPVPNPDPEQPHANSAMPCYSTSYFGGSHHQFYRETLVTGSRTGVIKERVGSDPDTVFPGLPDGRFGGRPVVARGVAFSEIFTAPERWAGMRGGVRTTYYSVIEERRIREFGFIVQNRWLNGASSTLTFAYHSPVESLRYTLVEPGEQAVWRVTPATAVSTEWDGQNKVESFPATMDLPATTARMTYQGREVIQVPAGTFETCRYSIEQGGRVLQEWIGMGEYAGLSIRRETFSEAGPELHELSELRWLPEHHDWPLPDPHWLPEAPQTPMPEPHGQMEFFIE